MQFAPAATVGLEGQVMDGGVWSVTVTVIEHVAVLLEASVAVMVMVCAPRVKLVPAAGLCVLVGLAVQLSIALAEAV